MYRLRAALLSSAVLLSLLFVFPVSAKATAPARAVHAGTHCVGVSSQNNWKGTICAIVNQDDAALDFDDQALITFSINSGYISEVNADGGLYLRVCRDDGTCFTQDYVQSPYKYPGNVQSAFLSNSFAFDSKYLKAQARVNTPCILWANGQFACYNGVLKSSWVFVD